MRWKTVTINAAATSRTLHPSRFARHLPLKGKARLQCQKLPARLCRRKRQRLRRQSVKISVSLFLRRGVDLGDGGFYFLHLVHFEDVALAEIAVILQRQTAFVTRRNFLDVVLETPQGIQLAVEHDDMVADDADLGIVRDLAFDDMNDPVTDEINQWSWRDWYYTTRTFENFMT